MLKDTRDIIWFSLVALVVFAIFSAGGLAIYHTFGVPYENTRRSIWEQTQSHVQGTIEDLSRLRLQYETADEGHRAALRAMIRTEMDASRIDPNLLPPDLRRFVDSLS